MVKDGLRAGFVARIASLTVRQERERLATLENVIRMMGEELDGLVSPDDHRESPSKE
jgi:hypothetical protein